MLAVAALATLALPARAFAEESLTATGSVTFAKARWAARRSCAGAVRYTAERPSGWRKVTLSAPTDNSPPVRV